MPRASLLDDAEAIERAALQMWVDEFKHSDHPSSRAAARRRWDSTTEDVRHSWRRAARRVIAAAENVPAPERRIPSRAEAEAQFLAELGAGGKP